MNLGIREFDGWRGTTSRDLGKMRNDPIHSCLSENANPMEPFYCFDAKVSSP